MKANQILVLFLFILGSLPVIGQKTKGQVSYDIIVSSDDPQTSAYVDQMEGSVLELYFDNNNIRSDMYLGEIMTTTNISHKGEDTTLTLLDGMMGKIAMKTTEEDMDDEQRLAMTERRIDLVEGTKEIMGYTCKKALITGADDNESVVWYTDEIVPSYREGTYLFEEIPGVLLSMESQWGKMNMTMVAFEYKKKIKKADKLFSLEVPKGYTLRSVEEMKAMRQGR